MLLDTDYNSGTIVELTAEPTGDWEFVEWTGDLTGSENPVQITIDGPKTVKAKFELVKYYKKLGPDYPSINQSSSTIVTNDFFPAFNMDAKFMYTKVNNYLNASDFGLLIREDNRANNAGSPTKFAEYALTGLQIISSPSVSDYFNLKYNFAVVNI